MPLCHWMPFEIDWVKESERQDFYVIKQTDAHTQTQSNRLHC